ncbi:unnamed protein product, partial [marine sediment metagenome]
SNQYIIEPFVTYKHAKMNNRTEMKDVIDSKSQADRILEMVRLGMLNRIYNYLNTAQNNEVIELDLNMKNFYYHTMFNPTENSSTVGTMQVEAVSSVGKERTITVQRVDEAGTNSEDKGSVVPSSQENSTTSSLIRLFGRSVDNPSAVCDAKTFRTPFDIYGGGYGEMSKSDFRSAVGGSAKLDREEYEANISDHLKNDLLKINMKVRGDPLWLLSPYGKDSGNVLTTGDRTNDVQGPSALVQAQSSRVFFLRMFAPSQQDYMDPDRDAASSSCSII